MTRGIALPGMGSSLEFEKLHCFPPIAKPLPLNILLAIYPNIKHIKKDCLILKYELFYPTFYNYLTLKTNLIIETLRNYSMVYFRVIFIHFFFY